MDFVTIREYLFSLPDSFNGYKVKIDYYIEQICPNRYCTQDLTYYDDEYSTAFDSLEETKQIILENTGHYYDYSWLYDEQLIRVDEDVKISEDCIQITIYDEKLLPFNCEYCQNHWLDDLLDDDNDETEGI